MRYCILSLILPLAAMIILTGCNAGEKATISGGERDVIEYRALPFELDDVVLLEGPFKHAMELNIASLLNYEPDRFLAKFRMEAGLEPKAEHYHGWEDNTIAGPVFRCQNHKELIHCNSLKTLEVTIKIFKCYLYV